jgi:hypothetical protein
MTRHSQAKERNENDVKLFPRPKANNYYLNTEKAAFEDPFQMYVQGNLKRHKSLELLHFQCNVTNSMLQGRFLVGVANDIVGVVPTNVFRKNKYVTDRGNLVVKKKRGFF